MSPSHTVLVVEDEPAVLDVVSYILEEDGFSVLRAARASEALTMLGRSVDLLLTDVVMPGPMNGFELAREARSLRPGLPIICMTGYIDVDHRPHQAFYDHLLAKPFKPRHVLAAVARVLTSRDGSEAVA
jgi:CheY-like chemotaxis protein